MNEIANLCEKVGVDVENVRQGICSDRRIGYSFIYPGCGYGGSCFPKDVKALIACSKGFGYNPELLESGQDLNKMQPSRAVQMCKEKLGNLKEKRIALLGLAFKPDTDDMREAPSLVLIDELLRRGASVAAYDPVAVEEARKLKQHASLHYVNSSHAAVERADALVIVTEWKEFRSPDLTRLLASMRQPVIFDGRNILDPTQGREAGLQYFGIGGYAGVKKDIKKIEEIFISANSTYKCVEG